MKTDILGDHDAAKIDDDFRTSSKTYGVVWCVGVKREAQSVSVKNLKGGPTAVFTPGEWRAFVAGVKNGEFDLD